VHQKFGDNCGEKSMKAFETDPDNEFEHVQGPSLFDYRARHQDYQDIYKKHF